MNIDTLIVSLRETGTGESKLAKIRDIFANVNAFNEVFLDEIRNWISPVTAAKAKAIIETPVPVDEPAKAKAKSEK